MKQKKQPRPSAMDELTMSTFHDHTHLSTYEIMQRRRALEEQAQQRETEIIGMLAVLTKTRAALKVINARLLGLQLAVERR